MFRFKQIHAIMNLLNAEGAGGQGDGSGGATTGTGDAGGSGGANGAGTTAGAAGAVDYSKWKDSLPDDLKKDSGLSTINKIEDLAKSYVSLQKQFGKDKIAIPDAKHATEADWLGVFQKLGAPAKVEDFKFKMPDGTDESKLDVDFMKAVKEAAVASGVMPHQFEKIFAAYHGYAQNVINKQIEGGKAQYDADVNQLKTEWGKGYDENVRRANVALAELVPNQADRQRLIDDGFGAHPVIMKALANASKYFKEDVFLGHGDGKLANTTPDEALARARAIQGDANHPYRNPSHPNHAAAKKEVADLFKVAFPE